MSASPKKGMNMVALAAHVDLGLFTVWALSFGASLLVVLVIVLLVYWLTRVALSIDTYADDILFLLRDIIANTAPLFALDETASLTGRMRQSMSAVEDDLRVIADSRAVH